MANTTVYYGRDPVVVPQDQLERIYAYTANKNPLLSIFGAGAGMVNAKSLKWKEKEPLRPIYLNAALSTGVTSAQLTTGGSAAGYQYPTHVNVGDLLLIESEWVRVTAVTGVTAASGGTNGYMTVTIARAQLGTSDPGVDHPIYTECKYPHNAADIDMAFPGAVNEDGTWVEQYVARTVVPGQLDTFERVITSDPGGSYIAQNEFDRIKELLYKIENSILAGKKSSAPTSTTKWGTYDGLLNAYSAPSTSYTAGGFKQSEFEELIMEAENNGLEPDIVLCGKVVREAINSWYHAQITPTTEMQRNLKRAVQYIPNLTQSEKPLRIVKHNRLPDGALLIGDTSKVKLYYLRNYTPRRTVIAEDGSGLRVQWEAAHVLQVKAASKGIKVTDITAYA